jgi:hypothetical protein
VIGIRPKIFNSSLTEGGLAALKSCQSLSLLYILSSFANDANSQPITCWHGVYSVTQDRINIHIHFVGYR